MPAGMNVLDAAYNLVHSYPGGAEALAPRMGKAPTTLSHEVAARGFAKFGLDDAVRATELSGNPAIVQAFAARAGGVFVPLLVGEAGGDLGALGAVAKEFGEFAAEFAADLADGRVTGNELARIEREALDLFAAVHAALAVARERHASAQNTAGARRAPSAAAASSAPLRAAA